MIIIKIKNLMRKRERKPNLEAKDLNASRAKSMGVFGKAVKAMSENVMILEEIDNEKRNDRHRI